MSNAVILAFVAAIFGGAMAFAVLWQERRSPAHWAFAAGMLVLAAESAFVCLSLDAGAAAGVARVVQWENYKVMAGSLLPGVWLFFSLTYARGNSREFLTRWKYVLGAAFLIPIGIALVFHDGLVIAQHVGPDSQWALNLTVPGMALDFLLLLGLLLVLMNLERTFRASVGTMRWRIKFMIVGLGVLFLVRAYTCSQMLLFHQVYSDLDGMDAGGLIVGCLLIVRSLLRTGHFEVN